MSDAAPAPEPRTSPEAFDDAEYQLPPAPKTLAFATWRQPRAFWALSLEQADTPGGPEFRVVKTYEHDLAQIPEGDTIVARGPDLRAAVREFEAWFEDLNAPPPAFDPDDEWWDPEEVRTLRRYDRGTLDEILSRETVQERAGEPASAPAPAAEPIDAPSVHASLSPAGPITEAGHEAAGGAAAAPSPEVAGVDVRSETRALVREVVALIEFERADRDWQEAMGRMGRAESIVEAVRGSREASERALREAEQVIRVRFRHPEHLLERLAAMDSAEVRRFAGSLRSDPLALVANESRTPHGPSAGQNPAVSAGSPEPRLIPVRARGLGGLIGRLDREATERQARVAAVALETWADARQRGDQTRQWAAGELFLPRRTPLDRVLEAAEAQAAELRESSREVIERREQLPPAPTRAQIERRLAATDPQAAEHIRSTFFKYLSPAPRQAGPVRSRDAPSFSR